MRTKYHYFYKIINLINGNFYYGIHSTNNLNDNYFGSGVRLGKAIKKYGKNNFEKIILKFFDNREELEQYEKLIVNEILVKENNCYNIAIGGCKSTINMVPVMDKDGNTFQVPKDDPRYLNGELIHVCKSQNKNMVIVKDKDGNIYRVSKDDPRYLSGELVPINPKGVITVKDQQGNTYRVSKNDPRYLSGELVGVNIGYIVVKDKDGNTYRVSKDDPRYLNGELIGVAKNTITVKDKDGNTYRVSKDDPRYLNGELIGVAKNMRRSITVKDKDGNTFQVPKDDPRYLNRELVGVAKNKIWVNNGIISKMIPSDKLNEFLDTHIDFKKGRK